MTRVVKLREVILSLAHEHTQVCEFRNELICHHEIISQTLVGPEAAHSCLQKVGSSQCDIASVDALLSWD